MRDLEGASFTSRYSFAFHTLILKTHTIMKDMQRNVCNSNVSRNKKEGSF